MFLHLLWGWLLLLLADCCSLDAKKRVSQAFWSFVGFSHFREFSQFRSFVFSDLPAKCFVSLSFRENCESQFVSGQPWQDLLVRSGNQPSFLLFYLLKFYNLCSRLVLPGLQRTPSGAPASAAYLFLKPVMTY